MNKTHSMTIGGVIFHIEEDAYLALDAYLAEIRSHFASYEGKEEILADIENRIAEVFSERVSASKQAVDLHDVKDVMAMMGAPDQFGDADEVPASSGAQASKAETSAPVTKRLYRNPDDRMISGVCSGIAAYFGTSATVVRMIALLFFVAGIFSAAIPSLLIALVYIAFCLIVPEARTAAQKIEMNGGPMTISNITEQLKAEADRVAKEHEGAFEQLRKTTGGLASSGIDLIRRALIFIFKIARIAIGVAGIAFFGLLIVALMVALAVLVFNVQSPYVDDSIRLLASGIPYYVGLVAAFFLLAIPCAVMLLVSASVLRWRSAFTVAGTAGFAALWVLSGIAFTVIAIDRAPYVEEMVRKEKSRAAADTVSRTYDVGAFSRIEAHGNYVVNVSPSSTQGVVVQGDARELERLSVESYGNTLVLKPSSRPRICLLCWNRPVVVSVAVPEIRSIQTYDTVVTQIEGFSGSDLFLSTEDRSSMVVNGSVSGTLVLLNDASHVTLYGDVKYLNLASHGASSFVLQGGRVSSADVRMTDAASARFAVEKAVDATSTNLGVELLDATHLTIDGRADRLKAKLSDASYLEANRLTVNSSTLDLQDISRMDVQVQGALSATLRDASRLGYGGNPSQVQIDEQDVSRAQAW